MKLHYSTWPKAAFLVVLFGLGGMAAITLLPCFRCLPLPRAKFWAASVQRLWLRAACRVLGVHITTLGQPVTGSGLWVSNHISWLDIIVLGALQPSLFLAKSEVAKWPVVGFLARQSGNLFIHRGYSSREVAEVMTRRLCYGERLVLFPEGTSTRGDSVRHFHGRLLQPAISAAVPIQPIAISYQGNAAGLAPFVDDDEFLPHLLRLMHLPGISVKVHFGTPLDVSSTDQRNTLAREARQQILTNLGLT